MNTNWNWTPVLIFGGVAVVVFLLQRSGLISPRAARAYLNQGALVVDVRSPGEFGSGHLSAAINLPLDEIATALPRRVPDKNQVLLLHCQSGIRSSLAKQKLRRLGYARAFNLGSFARARRLVESRN